MTSPPVPTHTAGEAAFMSELRRLKAWSGLSYRELERAAAAAGEVLPYSTAATMLRRDRLPREAVLVAFVVACGLDADDTRRWVTARRELAMGARPPAAPVPERPVRRRRPRLRLAAVGVVTAALCMGGATAIATTTVQEEQTVEGTP
ncbi:hypothetical protein [Streptomyces sp. NRRL B-1347]|uniref:hypothetical protein n=1 Tax=Streptomyces sp. NRRL B-1347 TaxID=1476877 RepID=UPI0004C61BE0|nr:hypothetical protein [Streptomyces sp. NRRL B-1347]